MRRLTLRPLIEPRGIDNDLAIGGKFDLCSVHGARGRTFEVDALAVVTAAVAGTLELVLARFPVWSAAEVGAARVDHEHAVGSAIDPDAVLLLKLGVDAEGELRRIADLENCVGFEKSAREERTGRRPGTRRSENQLPRPTPDGAGAGQSQCLRDQSRKARQTLLLSRFRPLACRHISWHPLRLWARVSHPLDSGWACCPPAPA